MLGKMDDRSSLGDLKFIERLCSGLPGEERAAAQERFRDFLNLACEIAARRRAETDVDSELDENALAS